MYCFYSSNYYYSDSRSSHCCLGSCTFNLLLPVFSMSFAVSLKIQQLILASTHLSPKSTYFHLYYLFIKSVSNYSLITVQMILLFSGFLALKYYLVWMNEIAEGTGWINAHVVMLLWNSIVGLHFILITQVVALRTSMLALSLAFLFWTSMEYILIHEYLVHNKHHLVYQ